MTTFPRRTLGELAESVCYGVTASAASEPIGPKFLRITDIQDGAVDWNSVPWCANTGAVNARLKPGDIVFARTGATTGKSYLIEVCPDDAVFASYLIRVRLKEHVDPRFVRRFFETRDYWAQISKSARGAAQPGVNASTLRELQIPVPAMREQRRIAAILDHADTLRTKRREALAQLDRLAQSIFIEMFGDPSTNDRRWELKAFDQICPTRLGKMLDQRQQTGEHRRKYLRNANVQWFRLDLDNVLEMDFDDAARQTFRLEYGDLLICEGGEPGRAAIWRGELSECYYQKALHRGRPEPSVATAEYLAWLLWFLAHQGALRDHVTSATIAHLTGEKLKAMRVPVPPLHLQKSFVRRLGKLTELRMAHEKSHRELSALFANIQHRAFSGAL